MRRRHSGLLFAGLVAAVVCSGGLCDSGGGNAVCGDGFNPSTGAVGDFGSDPDAAKVEAFLNAVVAFQDEADALTAEAEGACRAIGEALDLPAADMPAGDIETTCAAVSAEIDRISAEIEGASLTIEVYTTPGGCSVDLNASADCYAECDVDFDVEATPVTCEGGTMYVECSGSCSAECRFPDVEANCSGSCEGECTGTCSGSCYGECDGTCSATDSEGRCAGSCDGECSGSCEATCEGSCSAGCVMVVNDPGGCTGECSGGCDVEAEPLRCEGGDVSVEASAECEAHCEAEVSLEAECTPPEVFISVVGDASSIQDAVDAYVAALEAGLPELLDVIEQLGIVLEALGYVIETGGDGFEGAVNLGLKAAACAVAAVDVSLDVQVEVQVSVQASAEVSGSAGAN